MEGIHTVAIDAKIYKPKSIAYSSQASQNIEIAGAATLGILPILASSAIAHGVTAGPRRRLQAAADAQQIQIDQIVKEAFEQNLRRSGTFALGTPDSSDGILSVDVKRYGVEYRGEKGLLSPMVLLDVELNHTKGRRAYYHVIDANAAPQFSRKPEEFAEHPEFLRAGLASATDVAAQKVLTEWGQRMKKTTPGPVAETKPASQSAPGKRGP